MNRIWQFVSGLFGVVALIATYRLATERAEPIKRRQIALMLPLSGDFSRDSRDMQRAAELAIKSQGSGDTTLVVYNIPSVQTDLESVIDSGTALMFDDFKAGKLDSIYGYQTTRQMTLSLGRLRQLFGDEACAKTLNIHTLNVTTAQDPHRCYSVVHRGGLNADLAIAAADFIVKEAGCVVFLYTHEDPYAKDLVDKTKVRLNMHKAWADDSAEHTALCDADEPSPVGEHSPILAPRCEPDAAPFDEAHGDTAASQGAGAEQAPEGRVFDITVAGVRAPAGCKGRSVLFAVTDPSRFQALLQRARDVGFDGRTVLGSDSLLSREFLFSSEFTEQLSAIDLRLLIPSKLTDEREFSEQLWKNRRYVPGFADTKMFELIAGDLGVSKQPHPEPEPDVVGLGELRQWLSRGSHDR